MRLSIKTTYTACTSAEIDIPIDKWEDIVAYDIKYNTFHYTTRDKNGNPTWTEIELESDTFDVIDWKRPNSVVISDPNTGDRLTDSSLHTP